MAMGLKAKLTLMVVIIMVVASLSISAVSYFESNRAMKDIVMANIQELAKNAAIQLDNENVSEFNLLRAIANLDVFRNDEIPFSHKSESAVSVAKADTVKYENCTFYDKDGNALVAGGAVVNFAGREYFQEPMRGKEIVVGPSFSPVTNSVLMWYGVPVYDYNNKACGVMVSVIKGNLLSRIASTIDVGFGIHPKVIDMDSGKTVGDGNISAEDNMEESEDAPMNAELSAIMARIKRRETGNAIYMDPVTNRKMICSFQPVGGNCNWAVFCSAPYDYFFSELRKMNVKEIIAMILCVISASIICVFILSGILKPLLRVNQAINRIASGNADLTKRISVRSSDEIGQLGGGFNTFVGVLQSIVSDVKDSTTTLAGVGDSLNDSAEDTADSISRVVSSIENIHNQIQAQSESVRQTADSVNEISVGLDSLEQLIESQSEGVAKASASVQEMVANIKSVNESVEAMSDSFDRLQTNADEGFAKQNTVNERIKDIEAQSEMLLEANAVISNIAEQTNLLAMNAAIEAAHAGGAGKGFSVVADEIRKLSETSTEQSDKISERLNGITESIRGVAMASNESSEAFFAVSSMIKETDDVVRRIRDVMREQHEGSKQINIALQAMNDSTADVKTASAAMTENSRSIIREVETLEETSQNIKAGMDEVTVGTKKIDETGVSLERISNKVKETIRAVNEQINRFVV